MIGYVIKDFETNEYLSNKPFIWTKYLIKARIYLYEAKAIRNLQEDAENIDGVWTTKRVVKVEIKEVEE